MGIRVKEGGVYFDCPYCGKTAMAGDGEDDEGNVMKIVTHVLPYCDGFKRDDPLDFVRAAKRKAVIRLHSARTTSKIKIPKPN